MPPLRILHVTPYAAAAWAYGGIPRLTGTLTRELARQGHHVTLCATDACTASARLPAGWTRTPDGVEIGVFPNLSNRLAYHAQMFLPRGLRAFLRRRAGGFDVAHLHACRNIPGVLAARALSRAGVPYILAPNGTAPRLERRLLTKRLFDALAGHRVTRDAAALLAVSCAEVRQLTDWGVDDDRIHHIPNPVDLDEFRDGVPRRRFRKALGIGGAPLVVFLGKITPRKRVDVLVRAFARLRRPAARLVIAGNDMGALSAVRALVGALDLGAAVTCTGLLTGPDRLALLADADVVVYASEQEVFGLVPLEALLCGTPVVVASDSGCGEVVAALGGQHVVPAGDVDALTHAIAAVLDSPERSRAAAASAGERVRASYGDAGIAQKVAALYQQVVDRA